MCLLNGSSTVARSASYHDTGQDTVQQAAHGAWTSLSIQCQGMNR